MVYEDTVYGGRPKGGSTITKDGDVPQPTKANVEVTNPAHYGGTDYVEPLDSIHGIAFGFGIADKHLSRLGLKGGDNTPTRDAKAASWYVTDTMFRELTQDDGAFAPDLETFADWDVANYYRKLYKWIDAKEAHLGCEFAELGSPKRVVRGAIAYLLDEERKMRFVGCSEHDYRAHVMFALTTAGLIYYFADKTIAHDSASGQAKKAARKEQPNLANLEGINFRTLYKGTKANPLDSDDPIYATMQNYLVMLQRSGLISVGIATGWGFEDPDEI